MELAMLAAIVGFVLELIALIVGAVWVVGKIRTDSELNRQTTHALKETMRALAETTKDLTKAIRHIDRRLTILETKQNDKK